MRSRRRLRAWALVAYVAAGASLLGAARTAWAGESSPANVAAARKHFERARADYAQGGYREAIGELEAAHTLDPNAKDLVFNLGIVHEKLGDIEDALKWFRLYTTMSLTAPERDKADAYVHRLEGAKKELEDKQTTAAALPAPPLPVRPPPSEPAPPPLPAERSPPGRLDVLTIGMGSVALSALVFGVVLAVKAESDRPPSPFVTGRDGTYADLVDRQANAHNEAVLADMGFAVAGGAAAATAVLFFARSRGKGTTRSVTGVSAAPLAGGGAFFVQGSF
jgi:tetratricopeptide (TPR) repeat protein